MIKPATALPWSISSEYTDDETIAIERNTSGMILIEREVNKDKEDMQDAEYIKTACNEFPNLVSVLESIIKERHLIGACRDEAIKVLARCGVKL